MVVQIRPRTVPDLMYNSFNETDDPPLTFLLLLIYAFPSFTVNVNSFVSTTDDGTRTDQRFRSSFLSLLE